MTIKDLSEPEICGLQAIFPDIIKSAAPIPANTLKKLLTIINDEQELRRRIDERAKFGDWVKSTAEQIQKEEPTDEIKVGDRVEVIYQSGNRRGMVCEVKYDGAVDVDFGGGCIGHDILQGRIKKVEPTDKHNTITIPVKADLDDTYWDAYHAELVKELAVKVANNNTINDSMIAYHIIGFATQIVDNLKKQSE